MKMSLKHWTILIFKGKREIGKILIEILLQFSVLSFNFMLSPAPSPLSIPGHHHLLAVPPTDSQTLQLMFNSCRNAVRFPFVCSCLVFGAELQAAGGGQKNANLVLSFWISKREPRKCNFYVIETWIFSTNLNESKRSCRTGCAPANLPATSTSATICCCCIGTRGEVCVFILSCWLLIQANNVEVAFRNTAQSPPPLLLAVQLK